MLIHSGYLGLVHGNPANPSGKQTWLDGTLLNWIEVYSLELIYIGRECSIADLAGLRLVTSIQWRIVHWDLNSISIRRVVEI